MFGYLFAVVVGIYFEKFYRRQLIKNVDLFIQAMDGKLYTPPPDPWDEWTSHLKQLAENKEKSDKEVELIKSGPDKTTEKLGEDIEKSKGWFAIW